MKGKKLVLVVVAVAVGALLLIAAPAWIGGLIVVYTEISGAH